MAATSHALVEALHQHVDDGLRVVGEYTDHDYEVLYLHEDVAASVSEAQIEQVYDELLLQGLDTAYLEQLFEVGDHRCAMHYFEEAMVFHFLRGDHAGLFVSIDAETEIRLPSFLETCHRWL